MAKILFIHPPLTPKELFARGAHSSASSIPPLGIAYIAAYLIKHGHQCRILDGIATCLSIKDICTIARDYDIIGITVVSTYAVRAIELVQAIKNAGILQPVVVGGPHVTALPESLIDLGADYGVIGEGEITMLELVEYLSGGSGELRNVPGLVFSVYFLQQKNFRYKNKIFQC